MLKAKAILIPFLLPSLGLSKPILIKNILTIFVSSSIVRISPVYAEETSDFYFYRANERRKKGDYKGAKEDLDKVIDMNDGRISIGAYHFRGMINVQLNKPREALSDFNNFLEKADPNEALVKGGIPYRLRAEAKILLNDIKGACSDLKIAANSGVNDANERLNTINCEKGIDYSPSKLDKNFFNDKYLRKWINFTAGEKISEISKEDLKDFRFGYCIQSKIKKSFATEKIKNYCTIAIDKEEESKKKEASKECLDAKDYQGCMKYKLSSSSGNYNQSLDDSPKNNRRSNNLNQEKCTKGGFCLAKEGKDILGMPKLVNWFYKSIPDIKRVIYINQPHKVNVKGSYGRYIHLQKVTRYYEEPKAGTSSVTIGGGSSSTNCYDYGSSISCSTRSNPGLTIPGTPAQPGRNVQKRLEAIVDCKEKTYELIEDFRYRKKWKKWDSAYFDKSFYESTCSENINEMPASYISKYK